VSEVEENSGGNVEDIPPIELPPECGVIETEVFLDAVNELEGDAIVIDASLVEKMSAPFALAVVSILRHAANTTKKVAVITPPPVFVDAFSELGLFQDLMQMEFRQ